LQSITVTAFYQEPNVPTHSLSDYTSWIERTWQGQVSFTELVTYAETLNSHPALCAALYRTWLQRNTGVFNSVAWFNLGVILFAENNLIDSRRHWRLARLSPRPVSISDWRLNARAMQKPPLNNGRQLLRTPSRRKLIKIPGQTRQIR